MGYSNDSFLTVVMKYKVKNHIPGKLFFFLIYKTVY
jgi:hypothetical protein